MIPESKLPTKPSTLDLRLKQPIIPGAFYSRQESARVSGLSVPTIDRALAAKKLRKSGQGIRRVLIRSEDLISWLSGEEE